jgi:hypothetical protein
MIYKLLTWTVIVVGFALLLGGRVSDLPDKIACQLWCSQPTYVAVTQQARGDEDLCTRRRHPSISFP